MSGWLKPNSQQVTRYTNLQVQTSALNLAVPIVAGKRRLSWNLIWQGDFKSKKQPSGKGGGKGANSYTYSVAAIMALCEGGVTTIPQVWKNQSTSTMAAEGLSLMGGTAIQTPWSYLVSNHPTQALSYANTAYVYSSSIQLGSTPAMPQIAFEVVTDLAPAATASGDINLGDFIPSFLTSTRYGMGFGNYDINWSDVAFFKSYQQAQGLFFSPALITQEKAVDILDRWAKLSNSWFFWSGPWLRLVPLGDSAITANGATYTPVTTIRYDLTVADLLGDPPVKVNRIDPADAPNWTSLQITDRALAYNANPIEYKDQTLVDLYGRRDNASIQADEICDAAVGAIVVDLVGQRAAYQRNTYSFTLPYKFVLLEPGDLVTLTDPNNAAVTALAVRIKTIEEDSDYNLACTAEEFFGAATTGTAGSSTPQPSSPNVFNRLVDPGNVNTPCVLEPNSALTGGAAQVWIAASGGANWGGGQVYLSFDNVTYTPVGTVFSKARQGVLTAGLASHADPDTVNTLAVDLTQSQGVLDPVTHADADALRTLAYVCAPASGAVLAGSGEILAYGAVTSTGTYTDNLTYLRRGEYGTSVGAHSTSDLFTRLDLGDADTTIVKYDLPTTYIGGVIYVKLVSFNIYLQGNQDISAVTAWQYTPGGKGYGSGSGGVPGTPAAPTASASGSGNVIAGTANPATDNVTAYPIYRANGLGASFGSASLIGTAPATQGSYTYTDATATPGQPYTYFTVAKNVVGSSSVSSGAGVTTAQPNAPTSGLTASATLTAGQIVNIWANSGAKVRPADVTDDAHGADGFVLAAVASSATATVYPPGQVITGLSSLTPGATYWLAASGAITATLPTSGWLQVVGKALSATTLLFQPEQGTLL